MLRNCPQIGRFLFRKKDKLHLTSIIYSFISVVWQLFSNPGNFRHCCRWLAKTRPTGGRRPQLQSSKQQQHRQRRGQHGKAILLSERTKAWRPILIRGVLFNTSDKIQWKFGNPRTQLHHELEKFDDASPFAHVSFFLEQKGKLYRLWFLFRHTFRNARFFCLLWQRLLSWKSPRKSFMRQEVRKWRMEM